MSVDLQSGKLDGGTGDGTRRPEDTVRAMHVAHQLHRSMSSRPRARLDCRTRRTVESNEILAGLDERVRQRLLFAMSRADGPEVRARLAELAQRPAFGALDVRLQTGALDALGAGPIDLSLAEDADGVLSSEELGTLELVVAERFLRAAFGAGRSRADREPIVGLLEDPGFFALNGAEQSDLLRHLAGPHLRGTAGPRREALVATVWTEERRGLADLCASEEYRSGSPADRASMLFDYLHLPSERIYFLEALIFGGRSIVILGDPADPNGLSYGQIPIINVGHRRRARIESPDECVASAWTEPEEAGFTYSFRVFCVSRDEKRRFVEWAESSFVMNEHKDAPPSLGPKSSVVDGRRFFDTALKVVQLYDPGEEGGYMQLGRSSTAEIETDESRLCDELLARFLAVTV